MGERGINTIKNLKLKIKKRFYGARMENEKKREKKYLKKSQPQ